MYYVMMSISCYTTVQPSMQPIYFGDVEAIHLETKQLVVFTRQVYIKGDIQKLDNEVFRKSVLSRIKHNDRKNYKLTGLRFDTAKIVGETNY